MSLRIRQKVKETAKRKVLQYLLSEEGATATDVSQYANVSHLCSLPALLPEMVQGGLIERQEVPTHGKSKPYFITDAGRRYLEESQQRAMSTEPGQRQNWSAQVSGLDMERQIAEVIRQQPEFRDSGDDRIQEVTARLAEIFSHHAARER